MKFDIKSIWTEGDVETQVVIPILTSDDGLGIPLSDIRSKASLPPRDIGKGAKRKIGYVPDFIVYKNAVPLIAVEAKSPREDVLHAYTEARLYAAEINSGFATGVNPCSRVIACNGLELLFGYWDTEPLAQVDIAEFDASSDQFRTFLLASQNQSLEEWLNHISPQLFSKRFARPFNRGAGQSQIYAHVEPNTFAIEIAPTLNRYFASQTSEDDEAIYRFAYISSNEITGYDRLLESLLKDRLSRSRSRTSIVTSKKSANALSEGIKNFNRKQSPNGDLKLITGGVGSGKSLFARRYKEYLQPEPLKASSFWAFLNFNNAGDDVSNWQAWVCETFVQSLVEEGLNIDLTSEEDQDRVFAPNLKERSAFYRRSEKASPGRGLLEQARDIEQWRQDPAVLTRSLARYVQGDRGELLIVVFDNVDRRDSVSQLAAFQTALWFMDQTKCMLILQLRDSTFETFKNSPPLDTYKTGQIFHISPPHFVDVVKKRLELSIAELDSSDKKEFRFRPVSGPTFKYPSARAGDFLVGIYSDLFERRSNVARILEALAGRNVRQALDMFMTIITSGHLPESVLMSVAQGQGLEHLPEYYVLRALMRRDYKYFNEDNDFVANILYCQNSWKRPSNLLLPEIIFHLSGERKMRGDNGQLGFVAVPHLVEEMGGIGFVADDCLDALRYALKTKLIENEANSDRLSVGDFVRMSASGWAHMRILVERIEYL